MTVRPFLRRLAAPFRLAPAGPRGGPGARTARARGPAARRAVLWFATAFVAATAGFAVALDTCLPTVRFPEHGGRLAVLRQTQAQQPGRPLVAVIGSSRTQCGLRPGETGFGAEASGPLLFNYGLPGSYPVHLALGYHRLKGEGLRPAAVVVEVLPALLHPPDAAQSGYADQGPGLTAAELLRLGPDMHTRVAAARWARSRALAWSQFGNNLRHTLPLPLLEHERYTRACLRGVDLGYSPLGFYTAPLSDGERARAHDLARRQYFDLCQSLRVSPAAERAYRELVAACRADGVPVAFYLTPEAPGFRAWYSPAARAAVAGFVRLLRDDLGVPVFDPSGGWADADFVDGHHLTPDGAARFSRRFAGEHLRPWLATVLPPQPE